jgi:outer membrane cobalamin receptor
VDLVAEQPGWTLEANGILHPRESEYETQYIIDGFPVQENRSPAFAPNVEAENIQSMKVYTAGIPAEFGQKVGGVIEVTTDENASPGLHGQAVLQGGSFNTQGAYFSSQYTSLFKGRLTSASVSGNGFVTDRYLDPTVVQNYTNHGSGSAFSGMLERDLTSADRLRFAFSHHENHFEVPDELLQYAAGQREDRLSGETSGQASWQHVFSPELVGNLRGMVRDVWAGLWSNPLATPIAPRQNRGFREAYANGSLAGHRSRHEWKVGADARYATLNEDFGFHIASYRVAGIRIFDNDTPRNFAFTGRGLDREQSAYVQDQLHLGAVTVNAGLRFDHYSLLVDETAFSPRLGVAWNVRRLGTVLHASYDRTFGTPPFENILISASPQVFALNNAGVYLPLHASRGNYYEAGFAQPFGQHLKLESSYFLRDIDNFQDDDLLENTGVSFPITFHHARIRGVETKLEVPRWGRFSGFLSYTNSLGMAQYPIAGGLFLDDTAQSLLTAVDRFPVTQDQRNVARALVRAQIVPRLWVAWRATYNSGLPSEADSSQSYAFLVAQYGAPVVQKVNFDRGRVNPMFSLDFSAGARIWGADKKSVTLQADVLNLTDRLNVINFAGFLSGTALAPPRSFGMRLRAVF